MFLSSTAGATALSVSVSGETHHNHTNFSERKLSWKKLWLLLHPWLVSLYLLRCLPVRQWPKRHRVNGKTQNEHRNRWAIDGPFAAHHCCFSGGGDLPGPVYRAGDGLVRIWRLPSAIDWRGVYMKKGIGKPPIPFFIGYVVRVLFF